MMRGHIRCRYCEAKLKPHGPRSAGRAAVASAVAQHPQVTEALSLLEERFREAGQDGPSAYASFLASPDDEEEKNARLRQEAVATVRAFVRGFRAVR